MKNLENILQEIEIIQKAIMQVGSTDENLTGFWQWKIDLSHKFHNLGQLKWFFFFCFLWIVVPVCSEIWKVFAKKYPSFEIYIHTFVALLFFYWLIYLPYKILTYKPDNDLKKIQKLQDFIEYIHNTPQILHHENAKLKKLLNSDENVSVAIISEKILKTIEKISKYQKILPIFFRRDYINSVNSLILQEIQLLQNILEYSFHHQIQNHNTIISEISNLQNNEWKHFSEVLELQKSRLENQKNIFEKFLQK